MATSPRLRLAWAFLVAGSPGCAPVRREITLDQVCVHGDLRVGAETFPVDAPLRISVREDIQRSCRPPCDTVVESRCSVTREGNTFRVSARFVVDVACRSHDNPICAGGGVECVTEPVDAGEYVVTDGTRSVTVRVPSTVTPFGKLCSS